jgi:nitric oxide reductase NorQ protein
MSDAAESAASAPETRFKPDPVPPVNTDNIVPEASDEFVVTPFVQDVTERGLAYLELGYPVHFAGPAGTGKTTLAFHLAAQLGRPVVLIHGDDEFGSSDLIGRNAGYSRRKLVDNFIHSVLKTEEEMKTLWVDNRLTTACGKGYTLIYDEFTRSKPEANNVLLSILAEKILNLPKVQSNGDGYLDVHPDFRAIFTSNPEEYAGTHKTQDALLDRLVTLHLDHYDRQTEIEVTLRKSGVARSDAERIVDVVRALRSIGPSHHRPTIRACIMIARLLVHRGARAHGDDRVFQWVCRDVLHTDTATVRHDGRPVVPQTVEDAIRRICGQTPETPAGRGGAACGITAAEPDYAYSQT